MTLQYVTIALFIAVLYLAVRGRSLRLRVKEMAEKIDDVSRRARDFERRYEQDLERGRVAVKMEIDSALHTLQKQESAGPADPKKDAIIETLKTVFDPEIPVNVYDLGLIYDIGIESDSAVHIKMSLTSEACPSAKEIPADIERRIRADLKYQDIKVDVVWEPKWGPHMISHEGKQKLGLLQ